MTAFRRLSMAVRPVHAPASFSELGYSARVLEFIQAREYERPTRIQERSLPVLLGGSSAILAAETGTGKTLAYLLPVVMRMQEKEQERKRLQEQSRKGPRVVIFAPTRELSNQLIREAKMVSHFAKFKARVWGNTRRRLDSDVVPDVVVASPATFQREMRWDPRLIETLVLDECDVLLNPTLGFVDDIHHLVERELSPQAQIVCVGATANLHGQARSFLLKHRKQKGFEYINTMPNRKTTTRSVSVPGNIRFIKNLVEPQEGFDKHPCLVRTMRELVDVKPQISKVMLFCNSVASCRSTEHVLHERFSREELQTFCLHGDMRPKQREESFQSFVHNSQSKVAVLVCTDISSRGIDIPELDHVVLFDLPNNFADFIHRVGRCGRAGKLGKCTVIVGRGESDSLKNLLG